ncbi:MAG TPA: hypothetical protein VFJ52_08385 [Terriglobia bacterium]|nr:hypothetical protein [Terriglobia bacterium]
MRRTPWKAWLAVGGLLAGAFWLQQHDARIRRQARLQQLRNQTSARVSPLRKQAERDVKQANVENAKAIAELEQRRRQAEQKDLQLAAQLARLRGQAQIQAGEVATLPISEIVTRVAAQLGLNSGDVAGKEKASPRQGARAQNKLQITNDELQKPNAASAPHDTRTGRPCDLCGPKALTQKAQRPSVSSVLNLFNPQRARRRRKIQITNYKLQNLGVESAAPDGSGRGALGAPAGRQSPPLQDPAALVLTSSGARKVEAALVALHACRAENDIETQQVSTCQARAEADEAALQRQSGSIASLNQALQAKDEILARQQSEYKAELRAARGTFLGRLAHAAEQVAIGVAMGLAIGVAVK